MFRRLGRRFRNLLTRDFNLEEQMALAQEQETTFGLEPEHFYDQLEPATAALEEAKAAALGQNWKEAAQALLDHFHDRLRPQVFLHPSDLDPLVQLFKSHPQDCRRWVKSAELSLQHRFAPLQGEEQQFPNSIDWYSDFAGGSWMMASQPMLRNHFQTQPLLPEQQEGLLRSWSFNQLGHLIDLVRSHWLTGNEAYASECIVQAVDWSERNPVFMGMSWYHPKVVAVRSLHWYLLVQHLLVSNLMQGELLARFLKCLLLHAGYLALHLRKSSEHRLAAAASLYLISGHLPEIIPSKKWHALARQHLHIALQEDFSSDGMHRSGNASLHREALDWMLLCYLFDVINSRHPDNLHPACESALEALCYMKPAAGQQGESGPTLSEGLLGRGIGPIEHSNRLLALGALLLQRGDWMPAGEVPAELLWWLGLQAPSRAQQLERGEPRGIRRLFTNSQTAVVRDHWAPRSNWCHFTGFRPRWTRDHEGRYCDPDPIALPSHDDALSLALNVEGEPIFLEAGGPIVGGELGRLFGRLGAHTSVRIGRELEPLGVAPDLEEAPLKLKLESCKDGHYLCAQRPVWFDLDQPFWLTREILFLPKKQRVVLRDHLDGEGEVHLESNLLLSPHLDVLMRGDMGSLLRGRKVQARILPLFPARFRYEMLKGRSQGLQGFFYSETGKAVPTNLLRYYSRVQAPCTVTLWIAWNPEDTLTPRVQDVERLFKSR
ncbi:MAG: hypothetical protein KF760_06165 [Candidatus Eremiobacteraeota bacterium]|nr:hypothetical protein [Candidatus Eremiobacteraeota bacterium]MCW5870004.1 hypothetical protein [Candidatus Eremiobacteraeota bacterium]